MGFRICSYIVLAFNGLGIVLIYIYFLRQSGNGIGYIILTPFIILLQPTNSVTYTHKFKKDKIRD